jgi:hypothetical protein
MPNRRGGEALRSGYSRAKDRVAIEGSVVAPWRHRHSRQALLLATLSVTAALLATPIAAAAIDAQPPPDCNGNLGVLATPQNVDGNNTPFLTKQLTQTAQGTGSTTYFFQIASTRPSGSTFTELLDCAFSTKTGVPTIATYGTQQNNPTLQNGQLTITLTVNANDSICDRVQLKGNDASSNPFIDYSNLVGSPSGTQCAQNATIPEAPGTVLLIGSAVGALSLAWYVRRRPPRGSPGGSPNGVDPPG